jgi:hypothetical protein
VHAKILPEEQERPADQGGDGHGNDQMLWLESFPRRQFVLHEMRLKFLLFCPYNGMALSRGRT